MKVLVGLGNPGKQYHDTRHNIGFLVIEAICRQYNLQLDKTKFKGVYTFTYINGERFLLVTPLTYMNLSGECVRPLLDYYDIDIEDLIVFYDDLDIPLGHIRMRQKGSAGGHNGIKSLIQHLGTDKFKRVRLGIDRPQNGMKVVDYVLQNFNQTEQATLEKVIAHCLEIVDLLPQKSFLNIMNTHNGEI